MKKYYNYFDYKIYNEILKNKLKKNQIIKINTYNKNSIILNEFVDKILYVYNGKSKKKLVILEEFVGTKLGHYINTKFIYINKKKYLKKNIKKK